MFNSELLKKTATVLFVLVIILLVINVLVSKFIAPAEIPKTREVLSGIEIDKIFNTALKNYGLYDEWIVPKKLKNLSGDSLYKSYSITIPKNLPVHLILLELQELFWNDDVVIQSEEIKKANKTILKIHSENKLKLAAEILYDDKIKREYGTIAFLVAGRFTENDTKLSELLKIPELYYLVLIPSSDSKKTLPVISRAGKRYALLLNDDITELDYKLAENYSEDRLKKSIREIVGTFYSALFFIVDDKSDLIESSKFKFIESELLKRKIFLAKKSAFYELNSNDINVEGKFNEFVKTLSRKDEKILFVSSDEYLAIAQVIPAYRKIGYKFIYPGDIVIKR